MSRFQLPSDLSYNRGQVQDPTAYAKERGIESWLFLIGEEFVLAAAEQDNAPFCASPEIKERLRSSLEALRGG